MGLPAGLSSYPKGPDVSGVAVEEPSGIHQCRELAFGECRPQNPGQQNCGLFSRTWHAESVTRTWRAWGDPLWRQRQRSPSRRSVRRQQSGRCVSTLASRHRAAILSDVITNENLKLLQINYLARKLDVLFNFPSRSHCTCNRTYSKTVYTEWFITYWHYYRRWLPRSLWSKRLI